MSENGFDPRLINELARLRGDIDGAIQAYQDAQRAYEAFREKLARLPSGIAERIGLPTSVPATPATEAGPEPTQDDSPERMTHHGRMVNYFVSVKNVPKTTAEIRAATGLAKGNVSMILYRSHRNEFVKIKDPQTKLIRWKLKECPPALAVENN